jgi:hypothetical protein
MLAAGPSGSPHISLPGGCTVAFRSVTVPQPADGCSSVPVSVSLCGSTPISAIESLGLSGRGGQGDPCPEGGVLGPSSAKPSRSNSSSSSRRAPAVRRPSSSALTRSSLRSVDWCRRRSVCSAAFDSDSEARLRRDRPAAAGSVRLPERDRRRRRAPLRTSRAPPHRGAEHGTPARGRRPTATCAAVHLCQEPSWWECNETQRLSAPIG